MASKPGFTSNATPVTVIAGQAESVGVVYLLPDATVVGRVVGSDPAHEPAAGVRVEATSRNGQVQGPSAVVGSNGSFEVEVPPMPVRFDLLPPSFSPYLSNFTYLDASPGAVVSLGTLEVARGTLVVATFVDAFTGQPVNTSTELGTCDARTLVCAYPRGPVEPNGSAVPDWAAPGPTSLRAIAIGYVVNSTVVGRVPVEPPGTAFPVTVKLVPEGVFALTVNVSGGNPPTGGLAFDAFSWGWYDLRICSLDGVEVGDVGAPWNSSNLSTPTCRWDSIGELGTPTDFVGPPLRDWVTLGGNFGVVPFWPNATYLNLTPGRLLAGVYINYTPGAYVSGSVFLEGSSSAPSSFEVNACSTDNGLCGPVQPCVCGAANASSSVNASMSGCGVGPAAFCVAAPPGPSRVTVSGGFSHSNFTWVELPRRCCESPTSALSLAGVTSPSVDSINVSEGLGWTFGRVLDRNATGALAPALLAEVSACPVDPRVAAPCGGGPVNASGGFSFPAPLGWDAVTVVEGGYVSNSTWTYVSGNNSSGEVLLDPLGRVVGRALAPDGEGIYGGQVVACPIGAPGSCVDVGDGGTWAGGYFSGPLEGGAFPSGTYQIDLSASGYLANWTWANVTSGRTTTIAPVTLTPVSAAPAAPGVRPRSVPAPPSGQGTWVEGRVADEGSGIGISGAIVSACTTLKPVTCLGFPDRTSTYGAFNGSLPLATYWLNVTEPGYAPLSTFLNATSSVPVALGTLDLVPYPWVSGRVAIAPWVGWSRSVGFGPADATVSLCVRDLTQCGPLGRLDASGQFNVTGPPGLFDDLSVQGAGALASAGSVVGGFDPLALAVNVSGQSVRVGGNLTLPIFGVITGYAGDLTTFNQSAGSSMPVGWGQVYAAGSGPSAPSADGFLTQDGRFDLFFPGGSSIVVNVSAIGYAAVRNSSVTAPGSGGALAVAPVLLPHFGWVRSTVRASGGAVVPYAHAVGSALDRANSTYLVVDGSANGGGLLNMTAPPVSNLTLWVSAPDFAPARTFARVTMSRTSLVTVPPLDPAITEFIARSLEVSTFGVVPTPSVVDSATGLPVPLAAVAVVNGYDESAGPTVETNGLGQFMTSAPVLPNETLVVEKPGYVTNDSPVPTPTPANVVYGRVNLTGDAVVAGRVVAFPGGAPVAYANVTVCPTGIVRCQTVSSNAAGLFWAATPPGGAVLSLTALGFASNVSESILLTTDRFTWVGTLVLWALSVVRGTVVSAPFLAPVEGANVTLCLTNGSFALACAVPTPTDALGGFAIPTPGGTYELRVNATAFGPFGFTFAVAPGEVVDVGTIILEPYGRLRGVVVSGATDAPVPGAQVVACGAAAGAPCGPPTQTDASGRYLVGGPPGPVSVGAGASGYSNGYAYATVPPGATGTAPTIVIWPTGVADLYEVTGAVVAAGNLSRGLGGVTVAAYSGPAFVASTSTDASGAFLLRLQFGNYTIVASASGERAAQRVVAVEGPVGPLTIALSPYTYALTGRISDAATGGAVTGATLAVGGWGSSPSGPTGAFELALPNGTFTVNVSGPGGSASRYAPEAFVVAIDAAPAVHDLALGYRSLPVHLEVADADSGLPIVGVTGWIAGSAGFGAPVNLSIGAASGGGFAAALPPGAYAVWVQAPGYLPQRVPFDVASSPVALIVLLQPVPGPGAAGWSAGVLVGVGLAIAISAAAAVWYARRGRREGPARDPPAEPEGPTGETMSASRPPE